MGQIISNQTTYEILDNLPIDSRFTAKTLAERDALPVAYRYQGLMVFVELLYGNSGDLSGLYQLVGGVENTNWSQIVYGGAGSNIYPYNDLVTNPIGDLILGSTHENREVFDMIRDMISPYEQPAISTFTNTANGNAAASVQTFEIGVPVSGDLDLGIIVSNDANIGLTDPITIDGQGIFTGDGVHPYPSTITLTTVATLNPVVQTTYNILGTVLDKNGDISATKTTSIVYSPRIFWGSTTLEDIEVTPPATEILLSSVGLVGGGSLLSTIFKRTYTLSSGTYGYILIPKMLSPGTISWTDITNPNSPASVGMINLGDVNIDNGVSIYEYVKFRTPFSNTGGLVLKAA